MKRLDLVAQMCVGASCVVDVGCDHAKLCVRLVNNYGVDRVYAVEIAQGPLDNAIRTIKNCGLEHKITPVLCNGLEGFNPDDCDAVVIAGMGALEIIAIIERAKWLCDGNHTLILQPMTHVEILREYLCKNAFTIETEKLTSDCGWIYSVICAKGGADQKSCAYNAYLFSDFLRSDALFPKYIEKLTRKYKKLVENKAKAGIENEKETQVYNMLKNAGGRDVT